MKIHSLILQNELTRRLSKNSNYSLRAFSKSLGITPSSLSEIISEKRGISVKKGESLLLKMDLPQNIEQSFIESIKATKANYKGNKSDNIDSNYHQLTLDSLKVMSDWYHFAILNLAEIDGAKSSCKWISSRLSITQTQAKLAVDRLIRLELIQIESGKLKRTNGKLKTTDGTPSKYIKKLHRELLEKAISSLEEVDVNKRSITSMVMAIDTKNLEIGKKKIQKFRRDLSNTLEKGNKEEVYALTVSLVPISEVNR